MGGAGAPGENIFTEPINHYTLVASMCILIFLTVLIEKAFHHLSHKMKADEMAHEVLNVSIHNNSFGGI